MILGSGLLRGDWKPVVELAVKHLPVSRAGLQGAVWVPGVGTYPGLWILSQERKADTGYSVFRADGTYAWTCLFAGGGHQQSFAARRTAAGNIVVLALHSDGHVYRIYLKKGTVTRATSSTDRVSTFTSDTVNPVSAEGWSYGFRDPDGDWETYTVRLERDVLAGHNVALRQLRRRKLGPGYYQGSGTCPVGVLSVSGSTNKAMVGYLNAWGSGTETGRVNVASFKQTGATSYEPEGASWRLVAGGKWQPLIGVRYGSVFRRRFIVWGGAAL